MPASARERSPVTSIPSASGLMPRHRLSHRPPQPHVSSARGPPPTVNLQLQATGTAARDALHEPLQSLMLGSQCHACPALAVAMAAEHESQRKPHRAPSAPRRPASVAWRARHRLRALLALPPTQDAHKRKNGEGLAGEIHLAWTSAPKTSLVTNISIETHLACNRMLCLERPPAPPR